MAFPRLKKSARGLEVKQISSATRTHRSLLPFNTWSHLSIAVQNLKNLTIKRQISCICLHVNWFTINDHVILSFMAWTLTFVYLRSWGHQYSCHGYCMLSDCVQTFSLGRPCLLFSPCYKLCSSSTSLKPDLNFW